MPYGWMDFDAAQKINLDTQDGLWNLMLCQNKNIDLQSIVPITVITITSARGSHSHCWRCCSPLCGSSRAAPAAAAAGGAAGELSPPPTKNWPETCAKTHTWTLVSD